MGNAPRNSSPRPAEALPPPLRQHLTSPVTRSVMRVQQQVLVAAREFLEREGFTELLPPIIGPATDPGVRGAKQLEVDYYGHPYKVMTSTILYKQASLAGFDRIFHVAPNVRAEPVETMSTSRHLVEFHQIDVEIARASRDDAQRVAEQLIRYTVGHVLRTADDALDALGRDPDAFNELLTEPFDVLTQHEAVARLHELGHPQAGEAEIDWTGEELLSGKASKPFFIIDYPDGSRGFYDRRNDSDPSVLRSFDLIAPGGFGELISGSERESDHDRLVEGMRRSGEDPADYGWYLDMARDGEIPPSAGFGLGLQRLLRFITGLDAIWQVSAYPKIPGQVAP